MNQEQQPDADRLMKRMAETRTDLQRDAEKLFQGAQTLGDWRYYVRTYPWACMGAAAALGYFLAPRRRRKLRAAPAALEEVLKRKKLVVQAGSPRRAGLGVGLAGIGLRMLGQFAAREVAHRLQAGWQEHEEDTNLAPESLPSQDTRRSGKPR